MEIGGLTVPAEITGPAALLLVAVLVITRKLVWYKDLEKAEKRATRWEKVALDALGVAERTTVSAETTNKILSRLPNPSEEEG